MSKAEWPKECPDIRKTRWLSDEWLEIRRRWLLAPTAERLANAVRADMRTRTGTVRVGDFEELVMALGEFEKAAKP